MQRNGSADPPDGLVRVLGARALASNVINSTIGSGIFVLPAIVAGVLGPSAILAYGVCVCVVMLVGLCFAELGSRVDAPGGCYVYIERAFGPYAGYVASIEMWFGSHVFSSAAITAVLIGALTTIVPALGAPAARVVLILALYAALTIVNVRGVSSGNRLVEILTLAKLVPLVALVASGVWFIHADNLPLPTVVPLGELGRGSLILLFAFTGIESAIMLNGELREPQRTVPRGIFLGLAIVAALYAGVQLVAQGVLGPRLALERAAPLAATARALFGGGAGAALIVAATLSMLGCLCGDVLAAPRMIYAMAADGLLPRRLAAVHPRFRTPAAAICLHNGACALASLAGSFESLARLSASVTLLSYLGSAAALLVLRRRAAGAAGPGFRIAGGALVPAAACLVTGALLLTVSVAELRTFAGVAALATVLYFVGRRSDRRTGVTRGT